MVSCWLFLCGDGLSMIGRLSGILLEKNPPQVLVDVHGVGYEVEVPMSTFYNLPTTGEKVVLHTQFVVREDAQLLYGFATERERATFRQLLKVNGIGAKSALGILSGLSVDDLAQAITLQEASLLTRIPGIGKKTAERLLLELKDKLGGSLPAATAGASAASAGHDTLNALLALGYNEREALAAVKALPAEVSVSDGIRQALKILSRN
jgi:Holliday junction DNA helicase RuvA